MLGEAEQSSRANPKLFKRAMDKVTKDDNDHLMTLLKSMNPKKLSPADIDTLKDILGESYRRKDEAASLFSRLSAMVTKKGMSTVINQLAAISRRGITIPGKSGGNIVQNYGKAVPDALQKASDQAKRMEKQS